MTRLMTVREALQLGLTKLATHESSRLESELLIEMTTGLTREQQILKSDQTLTPNEEKMLGDGLNRRVGGEPLAYILGEIAFYKYDFFVTPAVLIPRPDTEILVEEVLKSIDHEKPYRLLDLGTGSGCIGLSLLKELNKSTGVLVDVSSDGLLIAKKNGDRLGVSERAFFVQDDIDRPAHHDQWSGPFDIIVSNPPYVSENDPHLDPQVKAFEPATALFSGPSGFEKYESWPKIVAKILAPTGLCAFEFGIGQGQKVQELFLSCFKNVKLVKDLSGLERVVLAREPIR